MITPYIPTAEELARYAHLGPCEPVLSAAPSPAACPATSPSDKTAEPSPRPSAGWTRHLRPVDTPTPAWASKPPAKGETSTTSTMSAAPQHSEPPATGETSTTSTTSAAPHLRQHAIPEDSILADYRDFVRKVSELPDGLIIAPILALCGKLLTPHVTLDFGGSKPLTIYNYIAAPAGLRKSTTFKPAEKIARRILQPDEILAGNASDSALFDSFETQPNRLQFEDEGNTLLRTWESSAYGREVSGRYLKLYDGSPWTQNFLRERKLHEDGKAERHIPQATLSLCIGSTFGVARLDNLDAGSGLRRRFGFYLATEQARDIWWPRTLDGAEVAHLAGQFEKLTQLKGVVGEDSFTTAARIYWIDLQKRNRARCKDIAGYTSGDEDLLSSLNESPARCLKLAVIFQACRWAKGSIEDPFMLTPEILALAEQHQNACLDALVQLEAFSRRAEVGDTAEWLLAQIIGEHPEHRSADYTRHELTRRFASNPNRRGGLTTSRLYSEIIPRLIEQGHCRIRSKVGKLITYTFQWVITNGLTDWLIPPPASIRPSARQSVGVPPTLLTLWTFLLWRPAL